MLFTQFDITLLIDNIREWLYLQLVLKRYRNSLYTHRNTIFLIFLQIDFILYFSFLFYLAAHIIRQITNK